MIRLANGDLLVMLRTGSASPMFQARSTDGGKTWSEPQQVMDHGVAPCLCLMQNGVLVCSYGRPHSGIMFSYDGTGHKWEDAQDLYRAEGSHYSTVFEIEPGLYLMHNGSFTLPNAPIEECSMYMSNHRQTQLYDWEWINADCDGTLEVSRRVDAGYFSGGWESSDNATVTIIFPRAPSNGSQVSASIESWSYYNRVTQHPESIISDGVSTEFTFPVVPSEFQGCRFSVYAWSGNQEIDVDVISERNNDCPAMNLTTIIQEDAGFIFYETGYGEFNLSSSAPEHLELWADYEEYYGGDGFAKDAAPCFGTLAALALGIAWLVQMVSAYKDGKTSKGTGMLLGIVPAVVMLVVLQIAAIIIFEL